MAINKVIQPNTDIHGRQVTREIQRNHMRFAAVKGLRETARAVIIIIVIM